MSRFLQIIRAAALVSLMSTAPAGAKDDKATKVQINAWVAADTDGDRFLTLAEFPRFIDAMAAAGQSTAWTVRLFGAYRTAFSVADKNGDGRVTPDELRKADTRYRRSKDQATAPQAD